MCTTELLLTTAFHRTEQNKGPIYNFRMAMSAALKQQKLCNIVSAKTENECRF